MLTINPTPYKGVNEILLFLLKAAKEILKDQFVGMYLYGSLSSGDFDPNSSDIDFLVVTKDIIPEKMISELEIMHNHIWKTGSKWASKLEGSYVHRELIRCHDPDGAPCPTINEGKFYLDKRGSDWIIQRHVIRECGIILDGPDPKTLIEYVTPDDIRDAVRGILSEWWFPMLKNPTWLKEHNSHYRGFAVITMCRALHALKHGIIISKPKAVQWARKKVNSLNQDLIDRSVATSQHKDVNISLEETLGFIHFIMEQIQ
ncbi:MAG TPA: nucleotidyltransferase domain-containing protein [Anaerolineales bacterium]|nr:nucleotidyltransferase domain-containing protein [Anaerolineales bacterium]